MRNSKYGLPAEDSAHVEQQLAEQRAHKHAMEKGLENLHLQHAKALCAELERRKQDA